MHFLQKKSPLSAADAVQKNTAVADEKTGEETYEFSIEESSPSFFSGTRSALHSSLAVMGMVATLVVALLLSGIGNSSQGEEILPAVEPTLGEVFLTDALFQQETLLEKAVPVFGRITLRGSANSEAILHLPTGGEIRTFGDVIVRFDANVQPPALFIEQGDVWVFSPKTVAVKTANYAFTVADGSARFRVMPEFTRVKTWRNMVALRTQQGEGMEIPLPLLSESILPEISKGVLSESILRQLRFSKILKEFQVTLVKEEQSDTFSRKRDSLLALELANTRAQKIRVENLFLPKLQMFLSLFEKQKNMPAEKIWTAKKDKIFSAFLERNTTELSAMLAVENFSTSQLGELLAETELLQAKAENGVLRYMLEDEILQAKAGQEHTDFRGSMLQSSFAALQTGFDLRNSQWIAAEEQRIRDLWNAAQDADFSFRLSLHRENLFRLFTFFPTLVTADSLELLSFLDEKEIAAMDFAEKETTQLEIVQKKLILAKKFVISGQTAIARNVLSSAEEVLAALEISDKAAALRNIEAQQSELRRQLLACELFAVCADQEYRTWFQTKKLIACQTEGACAETEFLAWLDTFLNGDTLKAAAPDIDENDLLFEEIFTDPLARAQSILDSAEITLREGAPENAEFFRIVEAITPNNFSFAARLSLRFSYVEEVVLADGTRLSGIIAVSNLENVIARTLAAQNQTEIDENMPDALPPDEEENTSEQLSPSLAALIIRTVQPELLDAGLIALREDIIPASFSRGRVQMALVAPEEVAVSFDYILNRDTGVRRIENVKFLDFAGISIASVPLEDAAQEILEATLQYQSNKKHLEESLLLLTRAGFELDPQNTAYADQLNATTFTDLFDPRNNLTFSGAFDPVAQVFLTLRNKEQQWEVPNISLEDYADLVVDPASYRNAFDQLNDEERSILASALEAQILPEIDSATATSERKTESEMLGIIEDIFRRHGVDFSLANLSLDAVSQTIQFSGVNLVRHNISLSGEFDVTTNLFTTLSGTGVITQYNLTFEEFLRRSGLLS